jgi:hypothetical protein
MLVATMVVMDVVCKTLVISKLKAQSVYGRVDQKVNFKADGYVFQSPYTLNQSHGRLSLLWDSLPCD